MSNLPDSVRDCDLPGNRPEDLVEEVYEDWLDAKEGDGKTKKHHLLEDYCLDFLNIKIGSSHSRNFLGKWMLALYDAEESMPTGLAEFDAYCRKIYEEGE